MLFKFDNSYALLPERFFFRQLPAPASRPRLIAFNHGLAAELGMDLNNVSEEDLAEIFAGNVVPEGADPLSMAYAGHQFGYFVPQLGDGRAILLGEVTDRHGIRRDIQLKGSGQTPFSRQGDGKAALGPVIREYIISGAMHALGIRTTRSLAAVITGDPVYRQEILPGAVLTRVASSHVRIGTFEYFAAREDQDALRLLADYVIRRHYPEAKNAENPYLGLLENVIEAQSRLVAGWMCIGFIHGVMNTDNMALCGETIDYGPCAFMDHYDPMKVFSSIDRHGRYAFSNQPHIAGWNLARFAETLLPLLAQDNGKAITAAEELLATFTARFERHWLSGMRKKLGLFGENASDITLAAEFLELMHKNNADYTLSFRLLCDAADANAGDEALRQLFTGESIGNWLTRWRARLMPETQPTQKAARAQAMRQANPAYIPRNHQIERAIEAAVQNNDFSPMEELQRVLATPYQEQESFGEYALAPLPQQRVTKTFCGT